MSSIITKEDGCFCIFIQGEPALKQAIWDEFSYEQPTYKRRPERYLIGIHPAIVGVMYKFIKQYELLIDRPLLPLFDEYLKERAKHGNELRK